MYFNFLPLILSTLIIIFQDNDCSSTHFVALKRSKIIIKLHNFIKKIIVFLQSGYLPSQVESFTESNFCTEELLAPEIKHLKIILYRLKNPLRHYSVVDELHHVRFIYLCLILSNIVSSNFFHSFHRSGTIFLIWLLVQSSFISISSTICYLILHPVKTPDPKLFSSQQHLSVHSKRIEYAALFFALCSLALANAFENWMVAGSSRPNCSLVSASCRGSEVCFSRVWKGPCAPPIVSHCAHSAAVSSALLGKRFDCHPLPTHNQFCSCAVLHAASL